MIYVMSDIHGDYDKYLKMLELIDFNEEDTLYILGDFVDRGKKGIKLLFDVMDRSNVIPIIGNHDWTLFLLLGHYKSLVKNIGIEEVKKMYELWFFDGGRPTYEEYILLDKKSKIKLLRFIKNMPYYVEIEVKGTKYFMAHTFPPLDDESLLDHEAMDFIDGKVDYDKRYFNDKIIITGHTPTVLIDEKSKGKIWKGNGHIAIDCGAGFNIALGCLCLDTMKEYYVQNK